MRSAKTKIILISAMLAIYLTGAFFVFSPWIKTAIQTQKSNAVVERFMETAVHNLPAPEIPTEDNQPTIDNPSQKPEPMPYAELYQVMRDYNERIYLERQSGLDGPDSYEIPEICLSDYGIENGVLGVLEIPSMDLILPIYLGASKANLDQGAACLAETSFPIGGINTNSVIAGHRGWYNNNYFKEIERVNIGDEIIITNLWEKLTYCVTEIRIIDPDDVDQIHIQEGRDMITLFTCHPFASGGQYRYLVLCDRVNEDVKQPETSVSEPVSELPPSEPEETSMTPTVCVEGVTFESSRTSVMIYNCIPWLGIALTLALLAACGYSIYQTVKNKKE